MASKSSPSKLMLPAEIFALGARMPSIVRASVVLPEPDSPTSPMMRPRAMVRLTPSSTRAAPPSVAKPTLRSRISTSGLAVMRAPEPGIEYVAQAISQQIEPHHDDEDGEPRCERVPL